MNPNRLLRAAFPCLFTALLFACNSSPTGPGTTTLANTYMTVNVDGKEWKAGAGAFFMKGTPPATATQAWTSKSELMGTNTDQSFIGFFLSSVAADSLPLGNVLSANTGEYRSGDTIYFSRSGYLKLTTVAADHVEGVFECEMVASGTTSASGKVIKMKAGKFLAYSSYAAAGAYSGK